MINVHFSHVHAIFWLEIELVLIDAGIWYQTNPVPDLHDTRTRNRRQKWSRFMAPVSVWSVCHGY